jgi:CRISPR/Cas system-associated exonuclease Cas4 (RecB family)
MDERANKMSGSAMSAYAACAGRFQLENTCPPSESGAAALMGNRIHLFLAGDPKQPLESLTEEERDIAGRCLEEQLAVMQSLPHQLGEPDYTTIEKRLWYGDVWSGQVDRIEHWGNHTALVLDWKTGRVGTGNSAAENLQLRAYAVLVKKNLPKLQRIYVAVVQPMADKFTLAEYDETDLIAAETQIQGIVEAAMHPEAPRTPSPSACKYCRAKAICPEAGGVTSELAVFTPAQVPALSNEAISDFLDKADVVEAFIEAIRDEAKTRLLQGHEITGRKLASGRTSRSVEDLSGAFERLGLDSDQFLGACKVSVPALEKIFATSKDMKPAEAKATLGKLLEEVLVTRTGSAMMVRCKKEQ